MVSCLLHANTECVEGAKKERAEAEAHSLCWPAKVQGHEREHVSTASAQERRQQRVSKVAAHLARHVPRVSIPVAAGRGRDPWLWQAVMASAVRRKATRGQHGATSHRWGEVKRSAAQSRSVRWYIATPSEADRSRLTQTVTRAGMVGGGGAAVASTKL